MALGSLSSRRCYKPEQRDMLSSEVQPLPLMRPNSDRLLDRIATDLEKGRVDGTYLRVPQYRYGYLRSDDDDNATGRAAQSPPPWNGVDRLRGPRLAAVFTSYGPRRKNHPGRIHLVQVRDSVPVSSVPEPGPRAAPGAFSSLAPPPLPHLYLRVYPKFSIRPSPGRHPTHAIPAGASSRSGPTLGRYKQQVITAGSQSTTTTVTDTAPMTLKRGELWPRNAHTHTEVGSPPDPSLGNSSKRQPSFCCV